MKRNSLDDDKGWTTLRELQAHISKNPTPVKIPHPYQEDGLVKEDF